MTDKPKPCPFCQYEDPHCRTSGLGDGEDNYWVHCANCHADGPYFKTQAEAIAAWNSAPRQELRDCLKLISEHGGTMVDEVSCNGNWCAEQATRALDKEPQP